MNKKNIPLIAAFGIASLVILFAIFFGAVFQRNANPHEYDAFAQCLTQKHAVMYGASWCPHCQAQKAAFADSFIYINYVECVNNPTLCSQKGIDGYPTWLIGTTSKVEGFDGNTMRMLSQATGCPLPQ